MENKQTINLLEELVKKNPNNMDLGAAVRAFILELESSKKEAEKQNETKDND